MNRQEVGSRRRLAGPILHFEADPRDPPVVRRRFQARLVVQRHEGRLVIQILGPGPRSLGEPYRSPGGHHQQFLKPRASVPAAASWKPPSVCVC